MPGTSKLVGKAVENVLKIQAQKFSGSNQQWMTVGQVAEACEISKPTARKYMNMLVEAGLVVKFDSAFPSTQYFAYIQTGE